MEDSNIIYKMGRFNIVYYTIRFLEALLAVFCNSMTIAAVAKFKELWTTTNLFILSLAVADLLNGLLVTPLYFTVEYLESHNATDSPWFYNCISMKVSSKFLFNMSIHKQ